MSLAQEKRRKAINPLYFLFAVIMWIIVIGWLAVIFSLSSETADVSSLRSQDLVARLSRRLNWEVTEVFVRNCAHVFEFLILSALSFVGMFSTNHVMVREEIPVLDALDRFKNDNEIYIAVSLWITSLASAADEYHQIFVDGRSASLIDVFLDLSGAFVLMMIIRIVVSIYAYVKTKKEIAPISAESHREEI